MPGLQESEKESAKLQEHVREGQVETQELQEALQAVAAKCKEHETLVGDLSQVLQQQKQHIQVDEEGEGEEGGGGSGGAGGRFHVGLQQHTRGTRRIM